MREEEEEEGQEGKPVREMESFGVTERRVKRRKLIVVKSEKHTFLFPPSVTIKILPRNDKEENE